MLVKFDSLNRYKTPVITLCNPNRKELGQLSVPKNFDVALRFNAVSEISFRYDYLQNGKIKSPFYNEITSRRCIYLDGFGYFIITQNDETDNGRERYKSVVASSCEIELSFRKLNLFTGTYKFYDHINPQDTLLGEILSYVPNWSVEYVDPDIINKYRTFDISDTTIYGFLMNDVEISFECVFLFDSTKRTISAYSINNLIRRTDIYIDYVNLLNNTQVNETSNEITTVLACYGGGNLDISGVNPLGSNYIYNWNYFKSMMSSGLVNSLNTWESLVQSQTAIYKQNLLLLRSTNVDLLSESAILIDLRNQLLSAEGVQAVQIQQGIDKDDPTTYAITYNLVQQLMSDITSQELVVQNLQTQVDNIKTTLSNISTSLSFENNFTQDELLELDNYMFESTYQDDTFIQTTNMTDVEIQDMQQELYDQCERYLSRISEPRYDISIDSANFILLKGFQKFTNQLELGHLINVEVERGVYTEPVLLEVRYSYTSPDSFEMTFGNRYRLNDASWSFTDLYGQTASTSNSVSFNGSGWNEWTSKKNDVLGFINNSINLSHNALVNNPDTQTITIDTNGLRGKALNSNGIFSDKQVWLTNNILAFSDDGFRSSKTVIGEVHMPDGTTGYGLAADIIMGKMIFGNGMTIGNDSGTIMMDSNGFSMTTNDGKGRVLLHPAQGISIQTNNGSGWENKFYVDSIGNAEFAGSLQSTSGRIGGFNIGTNTLTSTFVGIGNTSSPSNSTWAFWAGSNNASNAPFRVDHMGKLYSSSAEISGNVNIFSGTIGGWTINSSGFSDGGGGNYIYTNSGQLGGSSGIWWNGNRGGIGDDIITWSGNSVTFNGTVYARDIRGGSSGSGGWITGNALGGSSRGSAQSNSTQYLYCQNGYFGDLYTGRIEVDQIIGIRGTYTEQRIYDYDDNPWYVWARRG